MGTNNLAKTALHFLSSFVFLILESISPPGEFEDHSTGLRLVLWFFKQGYLRKKLLRLHQKGKVTTKSTIHSSNEITLTNPSTFIASKF